MMMTERHFFPEFHDAFRAGLEGLEQKRVAVVGHVRPDGDCIGSMVGLTRILADAAVAREVVAVNQDPTPLNLQEFIADTPFLAGVADFEPGGFIGVAVDCADLKRMGRPLREGLSEIRLNIDHHVSNVGYAIYNIIAGESAATAEVVAGLAMDLEMRIDSLAAQALYVGIATDTGQFRFSSTTPRVFEICHRLCELGADPASAAFHLYENERPSKLGLLQRFLASLAIEFNGEVCVGELSLRDFVETGARSEETEGLVDYARGISGVEIGILVEERKDGAKASLRSKDPRYQVHQIASRFGGGGHACAAGLNVTYGVAELRKNLMAALADHLASMTMEIEQ